MPRIVTTLNAFQTSKAITIPAIYFESIKTSYRVIDGFHEPNTLNGRPIKADSVTQRLPAGHCE
jgi:hypothetical protein